jgi:hypothetical protein
MTYTYTSQKQVRAAFWRECSNLPGLNITPRRIRNYSGNGLMHNTDTRCTFVDFVDALASNGDISQALANRVTL